MKYLLIFPCLIILSCSSEVSPKKSPPKQSKPSAPVKNTPKKATALESVKSWLKLMDEEKYSESWDHASPLFKKEGPREEWVGNIKSIRDALGKMVKRTKESEMPLTNPSNAPPGKYVRFTFKTSFSKNDAILEIVVVYLEDSGDWKGIGYFFNDVREVIKEEK